MEAEIYSKTNCGYCDRAKLRLAKYNPKIYMLDSDYTREDFFEKFPNAKTFPQIILNGEKIGGYHELEKWFEMNTYDAVSYTHLTLPTTVSV